MKELSDERQWEREQRAIRRDPILYLSMGSAVAIIGQFGDFPIEKEIVDRVAGTWNANRY